MTSLRFDVMERGNSQEEWDGGVWRLEKGGERWEEKRRLGSACTLRGG